MRQAIKIVSRSIMCAAWIDELVCSVAAASELQEEVDKGRLVVRKVKGDENAADLMTKILSLREVVD